MTIRHLLVSAASILACASANAQKLDDYREIFQVTWENDIFVGKDGGYTNGLALGYAKGPFNKFNNETLPAWLQFIAEPLPYYNADGFEYAASYLFGQGMQTPSEIDLSPPDPNDFPYAGLLFWQARLYFIGDRVAYNPSLTLGVVGELSGAEQSQKIIHNMTGSEHPEGWDHQLENEPVINLGYVVRWRALYGGQNIEWDLIPCGGIKAGNLTSYTAGGLSFRMGKGLEHSWPMADVLSDREADPLAGNAPGSWYFSIGASAQYVFNDLLVEGNTWKDSPGVDLKHEQLSYGAAFSYSFGDWSVILDIAKRTERSSTVGEDEEFGSFSVAWTLD